MSGEATPQYDVCLSFAGEDRAYVERVADTLRDRGIRVFYDKYEQTALWGRDLYEHLRWVYGSAARYCVLFASKAYANKLWTSHERASAQARAFKEHTEYILPARFDDTDIPGLLPTIGYADLAEIDPESLAEMIVEKLGPRRNNDFFPPYPDRLFDALGIHDDDEEQNVDGLARAFFYALQRMTPDERSVVVEVFHSGCVAELPDNVHVSLDLLRRETGFAPSQVVEILANVRSLGFACRLREWTEDDEHELQPDDRLVEVRWSSLSDIDGEPMDVAHEIVVSADEHYCETCRPKVFQQLDFSHLSSATAVEHLA